jgi:hypothetical protein
MASHGVFLALCGFEYDGPQGHIGFGPRMTPEDFRAAFTATEGWGTFSQQLRPERARYEIAVRWGQLNVRSMALQSPTDSVPKTVHVTLGDRAIPAEFQHQDGRIRIKLDTEVVVPAGESIEVEVTL